MNKNDNVSVNKQYWYIIEYKSMKIIALYDVVFIVSSSHSLNNS